jgi:hypothetical protein
LSAKRSERAEHEDVVGLEAVDVIADVGSHRRANQIFATASFNFNPGEDLLWREA